ncbi:FAD/NAD(P)-binding protein [Arthrobacter antibioticus]|uniref:FAD/NAD(P)-binding protein n=1 Tax=Arthrobacter sp. H35-MC1 TaxID=3046203 RepID=UPI0024BAA9D3|nr:FAD/NAD(P)-binding protein [Arthrobacter sp. H35-MC1]MDJ0318012.1 FAD/NAD(P)-binding protein [Arthrobacter sp. H35-MC1]
MESLGTQTVVIVGAGPRGTSVMERLLAHHGKNTDSQPLHIHLVDPFPPGAGHVWRTAQSRLYLMNTPSFFPTLITDQGVSAPPLAGCSFNEWRLAQQSTPWQKLSEDDETELAALGVKNFPSRALYGRYLSWCFEQLVQAMPDGVTLTVHCAEAKRVARDHENGGFAVVLLNGTSLRADQVVLALGHVESKLNPAQRELRDDARVHGLTYLPPAVPNDVDWAQLPAGETVLVRGMGLNFFDVLGQLTEGRGGTFEPTGRPAGDALHYVASGKEPVIVGASRRGTPYRAKTELESHYPASITLRFLGEDAVAAIRALGATAGFDHDIWPLLYRDALWAYYTTLARTSPDAITAQLLPELDALLHSGLDDGDPGWPQRLKELLATHVQDEHILDLLALARPLSRHRRRPGAGHRFTSHEQMDAAVLEYLSADAAGSARGEDDPVKMAIGALNAGRAIIKSLVADRGITETSWLGELRGWFEGFVEGLASGPPPVRMEQLAALVRAGVVHFAGPDPLFRIQHGVFTVGSPWVAAPPWEARYLVEALAPANQVQDSGSILLRNLLADGLARPRLMLASDGEAVATSGLDVSAPPYRPLDGTGVPVAGLYVLGLQLSSVQWGTAIAAEASAIYRSGYRTVLDAETIAMDILG